MKRFLITAILAVLTSQTAAATTLEDIQKRWAEVNYTLQDDAQEKAFEALLAQAKQWVQAEPNNAEAYIWQGIVQSTYAGAKGGLGALGLAKDARASLEKALALQPDALQGSAYASLGTLYFKVPGWPLGFGDDDKAKELLEKALEFNPNGIDPNYFYADYLYEQRDYLRAQQFAEKALAAPARPERPLADAERRKEVEALYAKIRKKVR
ncbi:hypothetical protein [Pseudidiomarina woesei]|uniref:Uncharacterized protein n=1 Tax=Pseudidiomarina woesei TaxID=1381080 RepID=A0A0K6H2M7_9GAMM|nr:hypothetical protein [Pseudidiomarina woesei]CUA85238.1 hypothetical protein Ga0061064_1161 [Pseudidiomarina woesei]